MKKIGVLLIILGLICIVGYTFYPKDKEASNNNNSNNKTNQNGVVETNNNNNNGTTNPNEEELVKNEVTNFIKFLNGEGEGGSEACSMHLAAEGYGTEEFENGTDMIPAISVEMYECLHNVKLEIVNSSPFGGDTLLSKEQYTDYKKYFNKELKTVEQEIGTEKDEASGFDPKPYIEKGYYYGYEVGDGFGTSNIEYQLETISKVDNHYEAIINATYPKESSEEIKRPASPNYKGVLKAFVVCRSE